mgnify:CR=1 FL=1|jgi:hypothetical protein
MKKKTALIFGLMLTTLLSFGSGMVIGQTSKELPRMTTACETKAGLVHGFDDGFSVLKKCPIGSRKVVLGEKNSFEGAVNIGTIKFVGFLSDSAQIVLLDKNGKTYLMDRSFESDRKWFYDSSRDLPDGVNVSDIVRWTPYVFLTSEGKIWYYEYVADSQGWIGPLGEPTE